MIELLELSIFKNVNYWILENILIYVFLTAYRVFQLSKQLNNFNEKMVEVKTVEK